MQQSLEQQAKLVFSLTDLTSLNLDDTDQVIEELCHKAVLSPAGCCAAVCVYPKFVAKTKSYLLELQQQHQLTKLPLVATVVNFPSGNQTWQEVKEEIELSLSSKADEIDLVFPYQGLIAEQPDIVAQATSLISNTKQLVANSNAQLKVIIESGALSPELISLATQISVQAGADFVKTSTGKTPVSATLEAAQLILKELQHTAQTSGKVIGFKASGGISQVTQAVAYIELAQQYLGASYITPKTFRFGASGIYNNIISIVNGASPSVSSDLDY